MRKKKKAPRIKLRHILSLEEGFVLVDPRYRAKTSKSNYTAYKSNRLIIRS